MTSARELSASEQDLVAEIVANDVVKFDGGGAEIRVAVLGGVLLDRGKRPRKLCLSNVDVVGRLDLEGGEVPFLVKFERCRFTEAPVLEQARVSGLYFVESELPGLRGTQVQVNGSLALRRCVVTGCVELNGAQVSGQIDMRGCRVRRPSGVAINAEGLCVKQDLLMSDGLSVEGQTKMVGARIAGQFICDGGSFHHPSPDDAALELSGLVVDEHTYWGNGFTVVGKVSLRGARISGKLDCSDAVFRHPGQVAVEAVGLVVAQEARFSKGCKVKGVLNLTGAKIDGWLDFTGGDFSNVGRKAIDLARATIAQNVHFRSGVMVKGKVLLTNAKIGGSLWCEGGQFENETDTAIDATGARVDQDVLFSQEAHSGTAQAERFLAKGHVVLSDAVVGGNLDCRGGQFVNPERDALTAKGIVITRDALFRDGFTVNGTLDLAGAEIGGKLDFTRARLAEPAEALRCDGVEVRQSVTFRKARVGGGISMRDAKVGADVVFNQAVLAGDAGSVLSLDGSQIEGALGLRFAQRPAGLLSLRRVRAATLNDRKSVWPEVMHLNEFVYGTLEESADVAARIKWLRDKHEYAPQVYMQLASSYEAMGLQHLAARVLMAGEDARRKAGTGFLGWVRRAFGWILKPTVGYGHRPFRILWWWLGLQLVGWLVFSLIGRGGFEPIREGVPDHWFSPFLYTADLLLPVVSLKHRDLWVPQGEVAWLAAGFTVMGWALAICLVTGVGRLFKRET